MKTRQHHTDRIEICRNCLGKGIVNPDKDKTGLIRRLVGCPDRQLPCPVCNGSGRVKKTTDITITVEAFVN